MKPRRIYVETSVWNFALAEDAPDKRAAAEQLLGRPEAFELFVGTAVFDEIEQCPPPLIEELRRVLKAAQPAVLIDTNDVTDLAAFYISRGIIPERYRNDAVHIASATYHDMEFLASYNFKHIVRVKTRAEVAAANIIRGYRPLELVTPEELVDYEKQ